MFLVSLANEKRWLIRTLGLPFEAAPWWTHEEIRGGRCGNELLFERMQFSNLVRISPPSKISTFEAETREQNRERFSFFFLSISRHDYINMKRASSIFRRENSSRGNNNNSFSRGRQLDEHANFILVEERVFAMFFEPCFPRSYRPPRSKKFFSNHFRELDSNSSNSREGG